MTVSQDNIMNIDDDLASTSSSFTRSSSSSSSSSSSTDSYSSSTFNYSNNQLSASRIYRKFMARLNRYRATQNFLQLLRQLQHNFELNSVTNQETVTQYISHNDLINYLNFVNSGNDQQQAIFLFYGYDTNIVNHQNKDFLQFIQNISTFIDNTQYECEICFGQQNQGLRLACSHVFCQECIIQWLNRSCKCPKCQKNLIDLYNENKPLSEKISI